VELIVIKNFSDCIKKTTPLKLTTQNLKNVELISASNLNTLSLLKAQQIILTPLAINDIKEIYCD
jgi:ribosomal protein L4